MALDDAGLRRVVITCPAAAKRHWAVEFGKWSRYERTVKIIDGVPKELPTEDILILSHESLARERYIAMLQQWGLIDALIVDEAHEFRGTSKRRYAVFGYEPNALWRRAGAVWPMTGTPIVNSANDLFPFIGSSLSRRLSRQITEWDFQNEFCHMKQNFRGDLIPTGVKNEAVLQELLRPFKLQRRAPEIPLRINTFPLAIADEALKPIILALQGFDPATMEQWVVDEMDVAVEQISRVRHAMGLAKAETAAQYIVYLIKTVMDGPVVGFFIHREVRVRMMAVLEKFGLRVAYLDGTTAGKAQQVQDDYAAGKLDVVLIQTRTGGTALTFTRGRRVVVVESPWTAVELEQEIKRVRRKTQTQSVIADLLYADGCWLEEVQARIIARKAETASRILG